MLRDYCFKPVYNKAFDDIAEEFYMPCMRTANKYDRISGYFGSTIYIIAWSALKEFVNNGGKMRIVCSPYISDEDSNALKEGYEGKTDEIIRKALNDEINRMFESDYLNKPARVLACLVAQNVIEVKLAVPSTNSDPDLRRLFHDKAGLFEDGNGDIVGFRGPMNETFKGLSSDGNLESIDVFPNWEDERDRIRTEHTKAYFDQLWEKELKGVAVYEFPEAAKQTLVEKSKGYNWEELAEEIKVAISTEERWKPCKQPGGKKPRAHQAKALDNWVANGRRGILEHATGSGKTFTAICAIRDALNKSESVLVLVPSALLLKQWKEEIEANISDIEINYLMCGDGNDLWKQEGMLQAWTGPHSEQKRITIAIMDTASNRAFLDNVYQGQHLFIVADEVHRIGSKKRRRILSLDSGARLGLSATPIRYGDPEGTTAMMEYFGGIVPPQYLLEDAIRDGVLTRYFYKPEKIKLTPAEQEQWDILTKEINRLIARFGSKERKEIFNNSSIKMKLIQRARIIKEASAKTLVAQKVIKENFKKGQRWIVYCDNQGQLHDVLDMLLADGYDAYEYYSEMKGDKKSTLDYFEKQGGILVSIRCLDEGVDIPSTTHALILASSQNPREFIQRRGRILRKAEGKKFAYLFDAVVIPNAASSDIDKSTSIIEAELARAIQFGEWAENPSCIGDLRIISIDYDIDLEEVRNGGIEEDDDEK